MSRRLIRRWSAVVLAGASVLTIGMTGSGQGQVVETNPEGQRVERALASRTPSTALTPDDYAEIQLLYARSIQSFDRATEGGRAFASAFTADGIYIDMTTGKISQGPEQLAELAKATARGGGADSVKHLIHSLMIEQAPEGAVAKAYVAEVRAVGGQPAAAVDSGQYWDVLERSASGWKFRKRNFHRATLAPPNAAPAATTSR